MSHSVRLRLINWLQSFGYGVSHSLVEGLGRGECHSKPVRDVDLSCIGRVDQAGSNGQVERAVHGSQLGENIDVVNSSAVIENFPQFAPDWSSLATPNNDFIFGHQRYPHAGNVDLLNSLNARAQGVQPKPDLVELATERENALQSVLWLGAANQPSKIEDRVKFDIDYHKATSRFRKADEAYHRALKAEAGGTRTQQPRFERQA